MIIAKTDVIAGVNARTLRDALRRPGGYIVPREIAPRLKMNLRKTKEVTINLEQEGYLTKVDDSTWRTSVKGQALAMAALRGTPREVAEQHLADLIGRAKEINKDDTYAYSVKRLVLFGSLLDPNRREVGDVDIWYSLGAKWKTPEEGAEARERSVDRAKGRGQSFRSFEDRLYWPRQEVMLKLKNRSRIISLHDDWEMDRVDWPRRVVFDAGDVEFDSLTL